MDEITKYKAFIKQISSEVESWPKWKNDLFNQAFCIDHLTVNKKIYSFKRLEHNHPLLAFNRA